MVALLVAPDAWGQQPNRKQPPPPFPLLPAEQTWLTPLDAPPTAAPAMDRARVYVPLQSHTTVAVDRQTGKTVWRRDLGTAWPVMVGDGTLYIAGTDRLHAVDPATGVDRWVVAIERRLLTAPVYQDGRVILILEGGDVLSLRGTDGGEQWRLRIANDAPLFPPVAGGPDYLYLALDGSHVVAVSLADGREVWRTTLAGRLGAPSSVGNRVFVGSTDNYLYALDVNDGDVVWKWRAGGDVIGAAGDARGRMYFASLDNMLRALNQGNGNQRWRREILSRPALPPVLVNDVVVLTGVAPTITSFNARDGAVVGTFTAPGELIGAPLIEPSLRPFEVTMVVLTRDGRLLGITPTAALYREPPLARFTELPGARLAREQRPN